MGGRYSAAEKGIGRLWGFSGGFLDLVPVIVYYEAGCWRGCCMIGQVFKVVANPKSGTGKHDLGQHQ